MAELRLHADAARNFNEKAEALLTRLEPISQPGDTFEPNFRPDIMPSGHITEADIAGRIRHETVDALTRDVVEIAIEAPNGIVRLSEGACKELDQMAEGLQRTAAFRSTLSLKFVRDNILTWLERRVWHETAVPLSAFLEGKSAEVVDDYEVWIPIAYLYIEEEFSLGSVCFRPISREVFDSWSARWLQSVPEQNREQIEIRLQREREKVQGLAAATITIRAEQSHAVSKGLERAEESVALLRILHPANSSPACVCYYRPLGCENVESFSAFIGSDVSEMRKEAQMRPPFPDSWELSADHLAQLRIDLDPMHKLLSTAQGERSSFQKQLLEAALIYSKNNLAKEPAEKLVFILVALEAMLLKNDTEPIQQNIADRMAFVLGNSVSERRSIVSLVKTCYGLRSRFLHHGQTMSDLENLRKFMMYSWVLLLHFLRLHEEFASKDEMLERIEERKFA
jgi:Apea-like HEPN